VEVGSVEETYIFQAIKERMHRHLRAGVERVFSRLKSFTGLDRVRARKENNVETIAAFREANPDLVERYPEMEIDVDAQASIPRGARAGEPGRTRAEVCRRRRLPTPGIPEEMRAAFETVADEFDVVDPDSARRDGS
jgi:hypothetical protein